jgi:hypothetical protein
MKGAGAGTAGAGGAAGGGWGPRRYFVQVQVLYLQ